ncbi:hypothetical protein [uncultured Streptomyces sp.]|uniref:hypothetical protein n=1 Tax=uncultured Streptomyces sp. TaxID=174707 RepID=UPI00261F0356|nr:hypothetical protein [uncultured Streptomyces sp.]
MRSIRPFWTLPTASLAVAGLLTCLGTYAAGDAAPSGRPVAARAAPSPEPAGAECRTTVHGSLVVAYCHNAYPSVDRVRLHTECGRWWDVDADGPPVAVAPGRTVRLTDRCWKEVASAWVSHART